jgi:hypothetical protein
MDTGHEEALRHALLSYFNNEDAILSQKAENALVDLIKSAVKKARQVNHIDRNYPETVWSPQERSDAS